MSSVQGATHPLPDIAFTRDHGRQARSSLVRVQTAVQSHDMHHLRAFPQCRLCLLAMEDGLHNDLACIYADRGTIDLLIQHQQVL